MAQRSHVPKFGNWESEENVPYTAYFDKARKGRPGTKMVNPNDPQENSDLFPDNPAPAPPSKVGPGSQESVGKGSVRSTHERHKSREDGDLKHFIDSPAHHDSVGSRIASESPHHRPGSRGVLPADTHRRPARQSAGSEYSIERSPLHRHARATGNSGAPSPSREGKASYESSHGTPGRSRLRPRADESPDRGAAVPKFGEWDESNPASADGFTHIFNKVREERQGGAGHVPGMLTETSNTARKQAANDNAKGCCFWWSRK
ncbi:RPM1-interacting protein 4-like [Quillaja saponaria]|uniref:RPM1-interacting protein 4-like n=1 Tax=Quillaja saponaria TaxID=32244 RepID=A0AAD7LP05_QUISA|nr:RPM1-interacting protein 4-like [Quillaja saponaria]